MTSPLASISLHCELPPWARLTCMAVVFRAGGHSCVFSESGYGVHCRCVCASCALPCGTLDFLRARCRCGDGLDNCMLQPQIIHLRLVNNCRLINFASCTNLLVWKVRALCYICGLETIVLIFANAIFFPKIVGSTI